MTDLENREAFEKWHFLQWKLHNAVTITVDFAKVLYDRACSHDHTSSVREVEFKAWQASAQREGFKLVPLEPNKKMLISADNCEIDGKVTAYNIYKAMIDAV